jgi:hypothetical protein
MMGGVTAQCNGYYKMIYVVSLFLLCACIGFVCFFTDAFFIMGLCGVEYVWKHITNCTANAVGKDIDILQSEPFHSIIFTVIDLNLLILFVHIPDVLCVM